MPDGDAWAKLVARAQSLEDALSGERASKRLLVAKQAQEKAEQLARLQKAEEAREGMEVSHASGACACSVLPLGGF